MFTKASIVTIPDPQQKFIVLTSLSYSPMPSLACTDTVAKDPEPILPRNHVVRAVTYQNRGPASRGCPPNRLCVFASSVGSHLAAHLPSGGYGHYVHDQAGVLVVLHGKVCQGVCGRLHCLCPHKTYSNTQMGLLGWPLSVPSWPWPDISLDFITGLPMCKGNITILTWWIDFLRWKTAVTEGDSWSSIERHIHGFSRDIVSD